MDGAKLMGARSRQVDLSETHLRQADLSRGDLSESDFRQAALRKATLQGTNLSRCKLQPANLRGADLGEARVLRHCRYVSTTGLIPLLIRINQKTHAAGTDSV
jgi:uncharacterized protein YjbI with pentapeptide repeats